MFEKVNPSHPDKVADRIAGALVDLAYKLQENPKIAVEVLIGHGICTIITESSVHIEKDDALAIVKRIAGDYEWDLKFIENKQDPHLAENQKNGVRCGDNGIFKGVPTSGEEKLLGKYARDMYAKIEHDGKYIIDGNRITVCQSNAEEETLRQNFSVEGYEMIINPLGYWTGGTDTDTGATNRKLGSDMGRGVTGGGLHGKDLSKADVSVNIYAYLKAKETGKEVELSCSIGDDTVDGKPYSEIVEIARNYIKSVGGFEKFAEWGLI